MPVFFNPNITTSTQSIRRLNPRDLPSEVPFFGFKEVANFLRERQDKLELVNGALKEPLSFLPTTLFSESDTTKTIKNIGQKTQNLGIETLHIIDSQGKLITSISGLENRVNIDAEELNSEARNGIIIHNHPSKSKILGESSFSTPDIRMALEANVRESIVYTNGRKYSMQFPKYTEAERTKLLKKLDDIEKQGAACNDSFYWHKKWTELAQEGFFSYSAEKFNLPPIEDPFLKEIKDKTFRRMEALEELLKKE